MPNLPQQLLNSLAHFDHFDEKAFVEAHQEENKITSIRLNPFKKVQLDFELGQPVTWSSEGHLLTSRPSFTHDPLFHAGCYYVQEAGSMFLEFALKHSLDLSQTLNVLDICAAPGGKSTLINSLLSQESLLVSNEIIKSRADVLTYNLGKWGTSNSIVTNSDPQRFSELHSFFDAIVVDAPCSGSGLFRKQPEAINEWSEDAVKTCSIRQQKILRDVLPSLKENGILIYSTCSYSVEENEAIVAMLIRDFDMTYVPLPIAEIAGIVETDSGYRFYPHLAPTEGFFCAVLRKKNKTGTLHFPKRKHSPELSKTEETIIRSFVSPDHLIIKKNGRIHLVNEAIASFLRVFEKQFYFKKAGAAAGEIKGQNLVPNHELAWYLGLSSEIKTIDLDKDTALQFLKKESFSPSQNENGLVLIRYKTYGLGWAKILPNRTNNYLPNELRIFK